MYEGMTRDDDGNMADPYDDAKVIARCVFGDDGKRVFKPGDIMHIAALGNDIVLGLVGACLKINGMSEAGRKAIAKNSKAPGNDS